MVHRDILVIGGSSGALEALRTILAELDGRLALSIFVVIHTSPSSPGVLDRILARSAPFPVGYAKDREAIVPGRVYVAPPDHHLLLERRHVILTRGPRENRFRPAVDPLFRTAAQIHGPRVIGLVLSGGQDDGAVGLGLIKRQGGVALVQDPDDALMPDMPEAAIRQVAVDAVLRTRDIPGAIAHWAAEAPLLEEVTMGDDEPRDVAEVGSDAIHRSGAAGPPSVFTCPDCGGTLWQSSEGTLLQFQCHIGHRFSGDALAGAQHEQLEHALWVALRALEESSELRGRMAAHARERGMTAIANSYAEQAQESELRAGVIRRVLMPEAPPVAPRENLGEPASAKRER